MESQTLKFQRIIAWIIIILLVTMVLATLIVAIFLPGNPLFFTFIMADIAIPIFGFLWIQIYKWVKRNKKESNQIDSNQNESF